MEQDSDKSESHC